MLIVTNEEAVNNGSVVVAHSSYLRCYYCCVVKEQSFRQCLRNSAELISIREMGHRVKNVILNMDTHLKLKKNYLFVAMNTTVWFVPQKGRRKKVFFLFQYNYFCYSTCFINSKTNNNGWSLGHISMHAVKSELASTSTTYKRGIFPSA